MTRRTILVLGRTGTGKSTLCNVLAGLDPKIKGAAIESSDLVSMTKDHFILDVHLSSGVTLRIVDTIGIGLLM